MVVTKEEALELFADNPFKVQILTTKVPDGTRTSVYKCGDLIDLCRGPHLPHTGKVKAFAATRHSATNWLGDTDNDTLQRMYGISFPDKKMLKVWKENQEKVRDVYHGYFGHGGVSPHRSYRTVWPSPHFGVLSERWGDRPSVSHRD